MLVLQGVVGVIDVVLRAARSRVVVYARVGVVGDLCQRVDVVAGQVVPDVLLDDLIAAVAGLDVGPAGVIKMFDAVEDAAEVGVLPEPAALAVIGVLGEGRADFQVARAAAGRGVVRVLECVLDLEQAVVGVVGVLLGAVELEVARGVVVGFDDAVAAGVVEGIDQLRLVGVGEVVLTPRTHFAMSAGRMKPFMST